MKLYGVIVGIVALGFALSLWAVNTRVVEAPVPQACTMEAKLCPDGSAVGRTGPNCEFAECPTSATTTTTTTTSGTATLAIGKSATIKGTTIGVLELAEDSRCPIDVQCIQAGTVRVRAAIDAYSRDFTFTLGVPQVAGNATVTLASVIPAEKNSKQTVALSDYRFTFTVVPTAKPTYTSGVRGTVLLGPTCPVERMPPDPACADKPYATTITVRREGSSAAFATGKSDVSGAFEFSLPPGSYTLTASGGTTLPRCSPVEVTVGASGYVTADISCDTGIR